MDEHTLSVLEFGRVRHVVAAFALTRLGRAAALALSPAATPAAARRALVETGEFVRLLEEDDRLPLGSVRDSVSDMERASTYHRMLEPEELSGIACLIRSARALKERVLQQPDGEVPALRQRVEAVDLREEFALQIEEAIDARGVVRDCATDRLGGLRDRVRDLREGIRAQVQSLARHQRFARYLQEEQITLRNDRFVLAVKREYRDRVRGVLHGYSQTGATLYVEPQETVLAGNELQAAIDGVRREENRILLELTRRVLHERRSIEAAQELLAWADVTFAKRELVRVWRFAVPQIAEDGVLSVQRARHPLLMWYHEGSNLKEPDLEKVQRDVIPFDLELGGDVRLLIVTGPNTGGKTVALKVIGLLSVMAACGIPVPAAAPTRIPYYRRIFVDVGDEQSLQQSLSTFSSHMKQVVLVVKEAKRGDLEILDELGAGTDPLEGAALGMVILDELRDRRAHVVVSTHLGNLKQYAYTHREAANAAMAFDPDGLRPTYRMLLGVPGQSCALLVAEHLGLPEFLVTAAREAITRPEPEQEIISRMEKARRAVEAERRRAQRLRRRCVGLKKELARKIQEADQAKRAADREAEEEIDAKVREVRDALMAILPTLKSVPRGLKPSVNELEALAERVLRMTPLGNRRDAYARSLTVNATVYVPRLNAVCRVVRINKSKRRLTVKNEGVAIEIGFEDISWAPPP